MGSRASTTAGSWGGLFPGRIPFCCGGMICCRGTMGGAWWRADIAEDAETPEGGTDTVCGRVLVTPETGSAFELDQVYRDGFFLVVALEEESVP